MSSSEYQTLLDSVLEIGVQNAITLFEGQVIDGWHRYKAANEYGMECPMVELGDVDPRDFVLAQNKTRRHITQAQLALAATSVYGWQPVGANQHGGSALSAHPPKTNKELSAIAGTGMRSIAQAKTVQEKGSEEVLAAVKSGAIGLPKAAAIAKLPQSEQAAAIDKPLPKPAPPVALAVQPNPELPPDHSELDAMKEALSVISDENDRLNDRLAVAAMAGTEEERNLAQETIESLRKEVSNLQINLKAVTLSRDFLMEQSVQMQRQMAMQRKEIEKLKNSK